MPQPPKQPFLNPPPNGEFPRLIFEWPVRLRQRRFGVGCVHLGYRISTSPLAREAPIQVADQQPATLPSPATATWHSDLVHGRAINPLRPAMVECDLFAHTRCSAQRYDQRIPKTSAPSEGFRIERPSFHSNFLGHGAQVHQQYPRLNQHQCHADQSPEPWHRAGYIPRQSINR